MISTWNRKLDLSLNFMSIVQITKKTISLRRRKRIVKNKLYVVMKFKFIPANI